MWAQACELLDRAERLHRQFFRPAPSRAGLGSWAPPVDMLESAQALWIVVALPGVAVEQIEILFENGGVTVIGTRALPDSIRRGQIRRMEIPSGRFERRIEFPPGRYELTRQTFAEGCLTLELHKLNPYGESP
jgi:HSP20 family molecular chaperone IbpA